MTKTKAEVQARLTKIASHLRAEIHDLEPRERKLALELAREYSETNVWWVLFGLKEMLVRLVDEVGTLEELPIKSKKKGRR
jgi:hypothetical protein